LKRSVKQRTPEEIETVWQTFWTSGDGKEVENARKELYDTYVDLVYIIWKTIKGRVPAFVDSEGLLSVGFFGLDDAIRKFSPERNAKFETYATHRIRGSILDELRRVDYVSRGVRTAYRTINSFSEDFFQLNAREPSMNEISDALNMSVHEISDVLRKQEAGLPLYYDGAGAEESEYATDHVTNTPWSPIAIPGQTSLDPFDAVEYSMIEEMILESLNSLSEEEAQVMYLRYSENRTFSDISQTLEMSPSRVSSAHASAIAKLRQDLSDAY